MDDVKLQTAKKMIEHYSKKKIWVCQRLNIDCNDCPGDGKGRCDDIRWFKDYIKENKKRWPV